MRMKKEIMTLLWMLTISLGAMADNVMNYVGISMEKEQKGASSQVWVQFPTGDDSPVRRSVIDFIFQCMHSYTNANIIYPSNTCDEETFKAFLDIYTDSLCHAYSMDQQEYAAFCAESGEEYDVSWFHNFSIQEVAESDRYVSYSCYDGEFCGGAHDNRGSRAQTFSKSDGAAIDIFVADEDVADQMQGILWKYLIDSEEESDAEDFVEEIRNFLEANYGNPYQLHLPVQNIFLAPDGVHLQYPPLEICYWAMGSQEIVIPYEAAKPFLTSVAARLAGIEK